MKTHFLILLFFVFPTVPSCVPVPLFSEHEGLPIGTSNQFTTLKTHPVIYKGVPLKIAGRIISAESSNSSILILAEWLPFPEDPAIGPESRSTGSWKFRFAARFSGRIDTDGLRQGNEFLLVGTLSGQKTMVTLGGSRRVIPLLTTECLHIWKTGSSDLREFIWQDPLDLQYPPPLEQTLCSQS